MWGMRRDPESFSGGSPRRLRTGALTWQSSGGGWRTEQGAALLLPGAVDTAAPVGYR